MSDGYKQTIDEAMLAKLETALAEFTIHRRPGSPGLAQQVEAAERTVRVALEKVTDKGSALVGGAAALLALLHTMRRSRV